MGISKIYARSTAAVPGYNVWELVVMSLVVMVGIRGIMGSASSLTFVALGPFALYWYISLIVFALLYMAGQFMMPPNGLVVSIFAGMAISIGSICAYAGLATALGTLWFTGFAGILIFGVGTFVRTIQMFRQLSKLQSLASSIGKEGYGINRSGTDYNTS